ncbi:MAG TPA: hypothetical protein QF700_07005, partial [Prochlorococcus sp.]|nr:hypothetical protein [Prochlorococcus sp.]
MPKLPLHQAIKTTKTSETLWSWLPPTGMETFSFELIRSLLKITTIQPPNPIDPELAKQLRLKILPMPPLRCALI